MTAIEAVALQLASVPGQVEKNLADYAAAVRRHAVGADLVVTPELVNSGYDLAEIDRRGNELAEPLDGPSLTLTKQLAAETGATIVFGLLERGEAGLFDSAVVVTPEGAVTPYRKSHLFPAEVGRFVAGHELRTVPTPAGNIGPLICFEHAFPEVATELALAGAQVLVIPSAVADGHEHLLTLRTRVRAQDNQVYAIGCNLASEGFFGGSLIAGPQGQILAQAGAGPAAIRSTLELDEIARERGREPALGMRRPELYVSLS